MKIDEFLVLQEFQDGFLREFLGMHPKIDIDFSIHLIPRVAPISRVTYRMSTPELVEHETQKFMDKA